MTEAAASQPAGLKASSVEESPVADAAKARFSAEQIEEAIRALIRPGDLHELSASFHKYTNVFSVARMVGFLAWWLREVSPCRERALTGSG